MRIIAGIFKGISLNVVSNVGAESGLRPTTDRVRENIFNILSGGRFDDPLTNARVLDLFSGTGALGIEALSRGASSITFIEKNLKACKLIQKNINLTGVGIQAKIINTNALTLKINTNLPFNLVFLDPPYGKGLGSEALQNAYNTGWIAKNALIVWEESSLQSPPGGFQLVHDKSYGNSKVTFLRAL
ncbi:MAG: 16S rRNA (guanine966-N2)-methyltransferase [Paracoccaceae bacterium]